MPNWCSNHIRIRGGNSAEIQAFAEAMREGRFFDSVIPLPEALKNTVSGSVPEYRRPAHEAQMAANLELYGAKDWYDFCVNRWGTKWDAEFHGVEVDEDGLAVEGSFDSAWGPPMGIAEELHGRGLEVTLYYHESGMAFCGKYEAGFDEHYDYGGFRSDTVRAEIGDDLDDFFAISENMAELEAEEQGDEELYRFVKEGAEQRRQETL